VTLLPVSFLSLSKKGYLTVKVFIGFSGVAVTFPALFCAVCLVFGQKKGKDVKERRHELPGGRF